jgi:predicted sulfurtransferase
MYCTGGIRCDVYSAFLRKKGFRNLFTLEGGVQNYLVKEGAQLWSGSLYVFDGRMAIPPGKPGERAPGPLSRRPAPGRSPAQRCRRCHRLTACGGRCAASGHVRPLPGPPPLRGRGPRHRP